MANNNIKDLKTVNIFELNGYVGKYLQIKLKNLNQERNGLVYTIDPVSESIILLTKKDGKQLMCIVMKHAVKEITILDEAPEELSNVDLATFFKNNAKMKTRPDLAHKKTVLHFLTKSKIPYSQVGDVIEVGDVRINPPYTANDCVSSHPIKLLSMQNIMRSVSNHFNEDYLEVIDSLSTS